jgi:hypothetical protein
LTSPLKTLVTWIFPISPVQSSIQKVTYISKPGILYAFKIRDSSHGKSVYKVGKTINLQQRMRPYRTLHPEGTVLHTIACHDMHVAEKWLHSILKAQGTHIKQELFDVHPDYLKELMICCGALCNTLLQESGGNINYLKSLRMKL